MEVEFSGFIQKSGAQNSNRRISKSIQFRQTIGLRGPLVPNVFCAMSSAGVRRRRTESGFCAKTLHASCR